MLTDQFEIALQPRPYTAEEVRACPTLTDALRLSCHVSRLTPDEIRDEMGIDSGQWSRIFNRSKPAHFPHDRLDEFMDTAGNDIVLDWMAWRRGKATVLLEDEKDRRIAALEAELEKERTARDAIAEFVKGMRA